MDDSDQPVLTVERSGHVATLWLSRPAKRNAMGMPFFTELPLLMAELAEDPDTRAIVIAPRGTDFSVGLDLVALSSGPLAGPHSSKPPRSASEAGALPSASEAQRQPSAARQAQASLREIRRLQDAITSVERCPKPTIAAIWGWCIGGGVDLAAACDVRLAAADARLSVRETKVAIVADLGSLQRLPRIIGMGHVAELAFTGGDIDAERAAAIGLVNHVYADADVTLDAALTLAAAIAANSPLAVQGTKAVLMEAERAGIDAGLAYVAAWNAAFLRSDDLLEAMAAFIEKRPANFTGT